MLPVCTAPENSSPSFDGSMYEIAFVVMSSYLAYLFSEALELSGIVSLFFTGVCCLWWCPEQHVLQQLHPLLQAYISH